MRDTPQSVHNPRGAAGARSGAISPEECALLATIRLPLSIFFKSYHQNLNFAPLKFFQFNVSFILTKRPYDPHKYHANQQQNNAPDPTWQNRFL
tara:strand:- start:121 stop:402 length:282 start_codon:yes stop_codon:yes gene_type:complete